MITHNEGSGIGRQPKANAAPAAFNNMGKTISTESRQAAYDMLKEIGVNSAGNRFDCVCMVADKLERDKPHEAMEKAMGYVDVTGAYRLFVELLVDR